MDKKEIVALLRKAAEACIAQHCRLYAAEGVYWTQIRQHWILNQLVPAKELVFHLTTEEQCLFALFAAEFLESEE